MAVRLTTGQHVQSSNLRDFCCFPQSLHVNSGKTSIRPLLFLSTFFPVYLLLVNLPLTRYISKPLATSQSKPIFPCMYVYTYRECVTGNGRFWNGCYGAERPFLVTHPIYIYYRKQFLTLMLFYMVCTGRCALDVYKDVTARQFCTPKGRNDLIHYLRLTCRSYKGRLWATKQVNERKNGGKW